MACTSPSRRPKSSFDFHTTAAGDLLGTGQVKFDYLANVT